ncbi:MAG: nidogen-like domain-containing protein [Rhodanobacter sp.]
MSQNLGTKAAFLVLATAVAAFSFASPLALAGTVAPGFNTSTFPANDDGASGLINLPFDANFFGTTYSGLYVSNNGYVTFNSGQGTYTPSGLGSGYNGQPIIAPFFGDVDTRAGALTSWGAGTYAGRVAFGATWPGVGYFGAHTDKLNIFQVILVDRSDVGVGDFDFYFNYDQIQWETGDASGGVGGLGGISAAVGYNAGQTGSPAGTYFQLPGSLVNGALLDGGPNSLTAGTNNNVPGQYLFQVRNGSVAEPPSTSVPEPSSLALFGLGMLGLVGMVGLRRRRQLGYRG